MISNTKEIKKFSFGGTTLRTKNSIRNSITAVALQFITISLSFIVRTIFINTLGADYLGINGLFSNILSILSLAELGVGSAIVYSMYKPMAENDHEKLRVLLKVYAGIYRKIGIFVIAVGCLLVPFLNLLIADKPNIPYLEIYFIIYILNTSCSYFFVYKASLLTVSQKEYIISKNRIIFTTLRYALEIIVLLFTENFIFYLLVSFFSTVTSNVVISYKADKMYPFIKQETSGRLTEEEKKYLLKNISALFFHRIGSVVVNGTDNLIISKFLGIRFVGIYSNYLMVIHSINTFINLIYNAITASIGNLNVTETVEKKYEVYKNVLFTNFWISGFCSISLVILLNPFIELWLGVEYLLSISNVAIIVANSYFTMVRKTTLVYRNAMGLFWKDRFKPLLESLINLIVSILLVKKLGFVGVFLGTLISTITTSFWIEPWILFKYGFEIKVREYFKLFAEYFSITVTTAIFTWILASLNNSRTLTSFIYKIVICFIVPNISFVLCFYNKVEFKYLKNLINSLLHNYYKKAD